MNFSKSGYGRSSGRRLGSLVVCAGLGALVGMAASAQAGDYLSVLPDVRVPSVDVNVDVDLGPPRPRHLYPARDSYAGMVAPVRLPGPPPDLHPVLAPPEVVGILRASGYSPLGPLIQRGWVYTISAIDPRGDDGRLIVDARTGRVVRFIPAYAVGDNLNEQLTLVYGPPGPPPVERAMQRAPRPYPPTASLQPLPSKPVSRAQSQASAPPPKVASKSPASTTPMPAVVSTPRADKLPVQGAQQTASAQPKAGASPPAETKPAEAKPEPNPPAEVKPAAVELQPTQDLPPVQGLE